MITMTESTRGRIDSRGRPPAPPEAAVLLAVEDGHVAHNYHPLDVVITHGAGALARRHRGRGVPDFLAAYSATNFGHRHPALHRRGPGAARAASP